MRKDKHGNHRRIKRTNPTKWLQIASGTKKSSTRYMKDGMSCDGHRIHFNPELSDGNTQDTVHSLFNGFRAKLQDDNLCKFTLQNRHLSMVANVALTTKPDYMRLYVNGALSMEAETYELSTKFHAENGDRMELHKKTYWVDNPDDNYDLFHMLHSGKDDGISINPKYVKEALSGMDEEVTLTIMPYKDSKAIHVTDGSREAVIMGMVSVRQK